MLSGRDFEINGWKILLLQNCHRNWSLTARGIEDAKMYPTAQVLFSSSAALLTVKQRVPATGRDFTLVSRLLRPLLSNTMTKSDGQLHGFLLLDKIQGGYGGR